MKTEIYALSLPHSLKTLDVINQIRANRLVRRAQPSGISTKRRRRIMARSTHQARNAGHAEFGETVPDIGLGWHKSMMGSSKPHYYPAPHPRRPTASFGESIRDQIILMTIPYGFLHLLIPNSKSA
ncbi:hypothetical protein PIB30_063408 [Stylosanthes scabra]|uniref:Uncharacterized protein n=1 Tax=Stylosanthes scabra TaxID=79078 RepID=A0ABU6RLE6_9FABA|nr:hypothetical protein [Stylosanthes scabra]